MERYFIDLLQLLGQTADLNELNLLCLVGYKNNFWKVLKKKNPKQTTTTSLPSENLISENSFISNCTCFKP